ncbi:hypothetical protein L873DRAFT_1688541, partial [Choiromyces venosus 120613-1]
LLSSQPAFQAQKGQLQETLEVTSYLVIFYPVYNYELNFIEYFWGSVNVYTWAYCEYSFSLLVQTVPEALAQVPNILIWKFYQQILHMMDAYRNNLVYGSQGFKRYIFTRYSSHRQIAESELCIL